MFNSLTSNRSPFFTPLMTVAAAMAMLSQFGTLESGQLSAAEISYDWSRFRGPLGRGISEQTGFPATWTADDYAWRIEIPGNGHSAPVVWRDRLFITSANEQGTERTLHCLEVGTGRQIWSKATELQPSHIHLKNSWASSTPVTDGKLVYVAFADEHKYLLTAYSIAGEEIWQRDLGPFESQHGQGSSPMLFEDLVIMTNDQLGPSFIQAFSATTGEPVWKAERTSGTTSYATPIIISLPDEQPQLLCTSTASGLTSLNPRKGTVNWNTPELPARTVSSPVFGAGLVIQTCGGGGVGKYLIAVNPSLKLQDESKRIVYERKKRLPYVPTPIIHGEHLYLWNDKGVVHCVDVTNGDEIWTKRVGPAATYSSSPICVDGKIYCINEEGNMLAIAASPEYHFLGTTTLDDHCHSTPGVGSQRIFIRTFKFLTCLPANSASKE